MIVVIGGVKVKVDLKMALPDAPKERPVQQTIQTTDDAYQTAYAERMAIEDEFWGSGSQDNSFGGYNPVTEEKKDDIVVSHRVCLQCGTASGMHGRGSGLCLRCWKGSSGDVCSCRAVIYGGRS